MYGVTGVWVSRLALTCAAALIVTLSQRLEAIEVNVLVAVIEHKLGAAAAIALCEEDADAENGQILQLREFENRSRRHTVRLDCKIVHEKLG